MMTKEFEEEASRRGYSRVYLHARVVAIDFYKKLGYDLFGELFEEVKIPHRHMHKFLTPKTTIIENFQK
jgi:predicted GNAT family N-acyltransferase